MLYRSDEQKALATMPPEEISAMRERMADARQVFLFDRTDGVGMLARMIMSAGIFDKIDPSDTAANGARNYVIDILDSMGLVSEEGLPDLIEYALLKDLPFAGNDSEQDQ